MTITSEHLSQMRHCVGFYSDNPGFRNYFNADSNSVIWNNLVDLRLAIEHSKSENGSYFSLTLAGKELIGLPDQIIFKEQIDAKHEESIKSLCDLYNTNL